ncbi:UDP-N-acetylglucosamine 2-epimerase (non-hydrolyzing) [Salinisphaera sp. SPP-AMP-43]|uniref:non-hydrolyzing UDP-N-acetylglucosamine 2-epimerase n=1 Tax=Salinisphaera sp. SPP-AMP-43 TaxID=3121288 RepID=UPI003C6E83DD
MPKKIDLIAAARPNFMKVAPLFHALSAQPWCEVRLVHTGQHYDANMSDAFFADFDLPKPDLHLGIGSGTHAEQTGRTLMAYEQACLADRPDWTIVVGDVNATIACALAASKLHIPVAHLEAGLRSRDRYMPEEINRILTDAIADVLWTPSIDANENLAAEGIAEQRIEFVGNIMLDTFELMRGRIESQGKRDELGLSVREYAVVTLHRPGNVDSPETLETLVEALVRLSTEVTLVFAVHPRTRNRLEQHALLERLQAASGMRLIEPQGYIDFMNLVTGAALTITDSGGMQEETTYLGIPCLTVRPTTERPITVEQGSNRLIGASELLSAAQAVLKGECCYTASRPELWDGQTAGRIVADLARRAGK